LLVNFDEPVPQYIAHTRTIILLYPAMDESPAAVDARRALKEFRESRAKRLTALHATTAVAHRYITGEFHGQSISTFVGIAGGLTYQQIKAVARAPHVLKKSEPDGTRRVFDAAWHDVFKLVAADDQALAGLYLIGM